MEILFKLKQATREDIHVLRMEGTMFFLKSLINGKLDPRPYVVTERINKSEFNQWYQNGQIYLFTELKEIKQ